MQRLIKNVGGHIAAILLFGVLVLTYFYPVAFDGKVLRQGDTLNFQGMAKELTDLNDLDKGEIVAWQGNMFSGMPSYHTTVIGLPTNYLVYLGQAFTIFDYATTRMVFTGLVCFYLLMCIMGVNRWLAIAGAIAYAFASYNIIILEAGHITKANVISFMPLTIAGMALLFKDKLLWGTVLFMFGVAMSLFENHLQITYYLVLLCVFVYAGYAFIEIKKKDYKKLVKVSCIMLVCVIVAALPNAGNLYSSQEMSKSSLRGKSELTPKPDEAGKSQTVSTGLDRDYAFQWSYGWKELLTVLVPDTYGGASGGTLDSSSELYKELKKNGAQVGKEVQTYTYWGDKIFTSGPVYFGALVCFLFVLGMFVIRSQMKWWLFAGALFLTFMALGRNFALLNDFLFHHLPLYNKFRTPEMALVIPGLVFPFVGIWGLKNVLTGQVDDKLFKKGFSWALGLTGGICLVLWLMPSILLDFRSAYDAQFQNQMPDWYYNALLMDRASLASSDALRSLIFILLGAGLLFWYWKSGNKKTMATVVSVGFAVLILADLWTVDRRYINERSFVKEKPAETYKESVADAAILKDKAPSYRVLNLNSPWQEANTAFFHKSVGGYHPAKLRRYQELIDHRLDKEYRGIIESLQKAKSPEDVLPAFAASPSFNMLNTRYVIYNPGQPPLVNPYAFGNAWFVDNVEIVGNADAEIAALDRIDPLETAVVDKRYQKYLEGFTPQKDSTATIVLESYRPNRLTYKSKADKEQLAVFSEIYYQPGWKATVDGQEVPNFCADWTLRAMRVPAGEHSIVFEFKPEGYITAAYISSYSSLLILLLLIVAIAWSGWKYWKERS